MYVFVFGQNIPIPELLLIMFAIAIVFVIAVYMAYKKAEDVVETQSKQITDLSDSIEGLAAKLEGLSGHLDEEFTPTPVARLITKLPKKTTKKLVPKEVVEIQKEIGESLKEAKVVRKRKKTEPTLSEADLKKLEARLKLNISTVNDILDKTSRRVEKEVKKG